MLRVNENGGDDVAVLGEDLYIKVTVGGKGFYSVRQIKGKEDIVWAHKKIENIVFVMSLAPDAKTSFLLVLINYILTV